MNSVSFCGVKATPKITKEIADRFVSETSSHQTVEEANKLAKATNEQIREATKAKYLSAQDKLIKPKANSAPNVGPAGSFFG